MGGVMTFAIALLGYVALGFPLTFVGWPVERQLARRIQPPRFLQHFEYRMWILYQLFAQFAVLLLCGVGAVFLVELAYLRPNSPVQTPYYPPFPTASGYLIVGLLVIVLPMLAGGIALDRRVRADGPEPPAGRAEVRALRIYLGAVLTVLVLLVVAVSIMVGMVG